VKACADCGSFGHRAKTPACPYAAAMARQDPYRLNPPRPAVQAASDPALRDATESTVFLIPQKRLV